MPTNHRLCCGMLFRATYLGAAVAFIMVSSPAAAQIEFEREPIKYHEAVSNDPVAQLQRRLDKGQVSLEYDDAHGYLPAVLEHLNVARSSQMLVFSKTSFQQRRIDRQQPRAVYFNDQNYVGWVQDGDVVELSTVDPELGAVFYTLS